MIRRTGVFLQARLGSTRLPGKALLKIANKTVITHAMEALAGMRADVHVLLTDHDSIDSFSSAAEAGGFDIFAGPAEDVLARFIKAAEVYDIDVVVRATGDNPLVDAEAAALILDEHLKTESDYSAFDYMPLGTGVEILSVPALKKAESESDDFYDHEHVSPYLYKNPDVFRVNRIPAPESLWCRDARVTLDTLEDFEYIKRLYSDLYSGKPLLIKEIIPWLLENRRTA